MKMVDMDSWLIRKGYKVTRQYDSGNSEYIFIIEKDGKTLTRIYKWDGDISNLNMHQIMFLETIHKEFEKSYLECKPSVPKANMTSAFITGKAYFINSTSIPPIKKVIFNYPATIILWEDNTKTVVKCMEGDTWSEETGLAMAICKKLFENSGGFKKVVKKWVPEKEEVETSDLDRLKEALAKIKVPEVMTQFALYNALGLTGSTEKKPMTCREKLAIEHPKINVKSCCPTMFGYMKSKFCVEMARCKPSTHFTDICKTCWDQPVEG